MKRFDIRTIALVIGMAFGAAAMAQGVTQDPQKAKAPQTSGASDAKKAGTQPGAMSTPEAKAAQDKRDADYVVAKEKCDVLAGEAKAACMDQAKAMHSKS